MTIYKVKTISDKDTIMPIIALAYYKVKVFKIRALAQCGIITSPIFLNSISHFMAKNFGKKFEKRVDKQGIGEYNVIRLASANQLKHLYYSGDFAMNLRTVEEGKEYLVKRINTDDEELNAFLFSLGCYSGEAITVVTRRKSGCVVSIKDGRYSIDNDLAEAIIVEEK